MRASRCGSAFLECFVDRFHIGELTLRKYLQRKNLSQRHPIDALTNIRIDEQSACWLVSTAAFGIARDFGLMPTSWQQANTSKHTFLKTALLRTRPDALLTVDISNPHAL